MKLGILSHTEHCLIDGQWHGLTPTVRELDHLGPHFDQIIHAGCGYISLEGYQLQSYQAANVEFVPLLPSGGSRIVDKFSVLTSAPANLKVMLGVVRRCDVVQVRCPMGMGIYLLPALRAIGASNVWAKYAGNWRQDDAPWSYAFQRWWLQRIFDGPVTINGKWPDMNAHLRAFENPCLTEGELVSARESSMARKSEVPVKMCFVGRLERAKGIERILQALAEMKDKQRIESVHFVGDGAEREHWEREASTTGVPTVFHGPLDRQALAKVYANSHYLLLPSDSEGFPKVIAEAAAFGVIPIASAVSAIPQYIRKDNGFLWPVNGSFSEWFSAQDFFTVSRMQRMSAEVTKLAKLFTFERYCARLQSDIIPPLLSTQ
ncbi:MAG: glycosyltransferase involved in cell wall biosynthesis [Verrucomicrobiales bacterium]|jgi:glycosyltransferase involved in cell wall biosynthesis